MIDFYSKIADYEQTLVHAELKLRHEKLIILCIDVDLDKLDKTVLAKTSETRGIQGVVTTFKIFNAYDNNKIKIKTEVQIQTSLLQGTTWQSKASTITVVFTAAKKVTLIHKDSHCKDKKMWRCNYKKKTPCQKLIPKTVSLKIWSCLKSRSSIDQLLLHLILNTFLHPILNKTKCAQTQKKKQKWHDTWFKFLHDKGKDGWVPHVTTLTNLDGCTNLINKDFQIVCNEPGLNPQPILTGFAPSYAFTGIRTISLWRKYQNNEQFQWVSNENPFLVRKIFPIKFS